MQISIYLIFEFHLALFLFILTSFEERKVNTQNGKLSEQDIHFIGIKFIFARMKFHVARIKFHFVGIKFHFTGI